MTPKDIDLSTSLVIAGAKATTLVLSLEIIKHDLPKGRTLDIIENAQHRLGFVVKDLIAEGNYLGKR